MDAYESYASYDQSTHSKHILRKPPHKPAGYLYVISLVEQCTPQGNVSQLIEAVIVQQVIAEETDRSDNNKELSSNFEECYAT